MYCGWSKESLQGGKNAITFCWNGDVRYCTVPISIVGPIMSPSFASESPRQLYEQATGFHQRGNLVEAERLYLQALSADASSFMPRLMLAIIRLQQGRNAEALELTAAALKLRPNSILALVNHGIVLATLGRFEEALANYGKVLAMEPNNAQALYLRGNALQNLKRFDEALASYDSTLMLQPHNIDALNNRSIALQALQRFDEALLGYDKALTLKPDDAGALYNYGVALMALLRFDEAVARFDSALILQPDNVDAISMRGIALLELTRLDEALANFEKALAIKPDHVGTLNNRGSTLRELGRFEEALGSYDRALALYPDFVEALYNRGHTLQEQGKLDEAEASYRRALQINPYCTDALNNLALLVLLRGDARMALSIIQQSLQIGEAARTQRLFVDIVKQLRWTKDDSKIRIALVRALTEPWGQPKELAGVSANLVKLNPDIGNSVARANRAWPTRLSVQELFDGRGFSALAADELLCGLLSSTPNSDIELERFLTMVRRLMLEAATRTVASDDEIDMALSFCCALARQCFINEYVFCYTDDEFQEANCLRDLLVAALEEKTGVPPLWVIAVAAYFPLYSLPNASQLLNTQWPDPIMTIIVQQVREPEEEDQLRTTIPQLTGIEDEVSKLVQSQYEENPYPRWVKVVPTVKSNNIVGYLFQQFPFASFQHHRKSGIIEILVAGCGTGQHSIGAAQTFNGAQVLAIDLSLSSLGYAKRKTRELNLTSIEYAQADLLELKSLGRSFDAIESGGVLHHLLEPLSGWRVLLSLLRPGGVMLLGLYSEIARRQTVMAREFVAERGYGTTADEIRRCRQTLMELDNCEKFRKTINSSDFYTISTCRDLLLHSQEHHFTLTSISAFLRDNDLMFLGFQIGADVIHAYRQRFPDDPAAANFDNWQTFENDNPDTFAGMYNFWIQKAG
jgi:tetratricopeptide (TPR) repeat protein/2-polyprenyl-3-methyl-5-hydroxy-6-metoxy-1,4-benzoquinol methylase